MRENSCPVERIKLPWQVHIFQRNDSLNENVPITNSLTIPLRAEEGSDNFDEFLAVIGEKIRLKGWERYRGGLDVKGNNYYYL